MGAVMDSLQRDLTKSQLFLDDTWVEDQTMLTRLWHKPDIYLEPFLRPEMAWESNTLAMYGTVLRVGQMWRMYYTTAYPDHRAMMYVADSKDGFCWRVGHPRV